MTDDSKNDLMLAGARDFLKASTAIREFGQQVFGAAARALGQREQELERAFGFPVTRRQAQLHPAKCYVSEIWGGTYAVLGLSVPFARNRFYLYACWRMDEEHPGEETRSVVASLELWSVGAAAKLTDALQSASGGVAKRDDYEVFIESLLKPDEFNSLDSHFVSVIDQWVRCSEAMGGLAKHLC